MLPTTTQKTVLLVDDEPMIRAMLAEFLQLRGLRVITARNGIFALDHVRIHGERPDLLIADLLMPAMGGLELLSEIRKRMPDLPALLMSGYYCDSQAVDEVLDERTMFLAKPFEIRIFEQHIRSLLPARKALRPRARPRARAIATNSA